MMKLIFTKDADWLTRWDDFVENEDKASHLMLSEWTKSFLSYGFDYEICICEENGKIVGGYAAVIAKVSVFKFYIVPYGPISSAGFESHLNELVAALPLRAKTLSCCYCHLTLPNSNLKNLHVYNGLHDLEALNTAKPGHLFKYVYSSNGLNWLNLAGFKTEEEILEKLKTSVRRDIRSSIRKGVETKLLKIEQEIKSAYELCLDNANSNNYSLRDWNAFRDTLVNLIEKEQAKFVGAFKDGKLKGAILLVKAANYYTYILGGTTKEKPDLLAGDLLQWSAIKLSVEDNLDGYNLSLGGSKGVVAFKESYADHQIVFENSKFHWIVKPFYFKIFMLAERHMKPYKKQISRMLSSVRRIK